MVTAAALFRLEPGQSRDIAAQIALPDAQRLPRSGGNAWDEALQGVCQLQVPDERVQFLYDTALRTLVLHSPDDVYPGPYTYKRFWFRDAAFIIHALLCAGMTARAERALDRFPARQTRRGYFHSQEGEWDSNGQALWIMLRFCAFSGVPPKAAWRQAIVRGARWIPAKRLADDGDSPTAGLLPAGFSAEHLGPNDYYYWDDFWGIAGLQAAAALGGLMDDAGVTGRMPARGGGLRAGRRAQPGAGRQPPRWPRHPGIALSAYGCRGHRFTGRGLSTATVPGG